jgi:sugar lactone lactonase YvrE
LQNPSRSIAAPFGVILCAALIAACAASAPVRTPADVTIADRDVYPESVTSLRDGTLITGSIKGVLYRALPRSSTATPWVRPDATNRLQSVFGVLADEKTGTLWLCSVPFPNPFHPPAEGAVAELVALDLASGAFKARYAFPPPRSVCNDVTLGPDGTAYAADTQNGRILKLPRGGQQLLPFGEAEELKGVDGIAFSGDGTLYTNIVTRGVLQRIDIGRDGRMAKVTEIPVGEKLGGPDGMRLIDGHRFLLAEGNTGRVSEVTFAGDRATLRALDSRLTSSPGVTLVGDTVYALEGKIGYLVDPKLRGQDPGAFRIVAIPLNSTKAAP